MAPLLPDKKRGNADLKKKEPGIVDFTVSREFQAEFHDVVPVNGKAWGDEVDPTFISQMLTIAGFAKMFPAPKKEEPPSTGAPKKEAPKGGIHESEEIWVNRPIKLNETITMTRDGAPNSGPHRLGMRTEEAYRAVDASGAEVMKINRSGLSFAKYEGPAVAAGAKEEPKKQPADLREGKTLVDTIQFTPQLVVNFCNDWKGVNPIHNDPEAAAKQGYKEPIWGGTQGMHICLTYLNEHIAKGAEIRNLHAKVFFKRPVHWTQKVELWFGQAQGKGPGVGEYLLLQPTDGYKSAMEMEVMNVDLVQRSKY